MDKPEAAGPAHQSRESCWPCSRPVFLGRINPSCLCPSLGECSELPYRLGKPGETPQELLPGYPKPPVTLIQP